MRSLADRHRREGMADAAVHLVASRFHPQCDLEDWARALGLTQPEVKAAIQRFREKHQGHRPPARRMHAVPDDSRKVYRNAGRPQLPLDARRERDARIRALRAEGLTYEEIAAEFDLTRSRVQQIVRASA